jgi:uncharacterized protein
VTAEPRVEELLASIRKAIDADLSGLSAGSSTSGNSQGTLMRGALREMRVSFDTDAVTQQQADSEIAQLRDRITRSRSETNFVPPKKQPTARVIERLAPEPARGGIGEILNGRSQPPTLRQSIIAEKPYEPAEVYEEAAWQEQPVYAEQPQDDYYQQPDYAPPQQKALISPQTAYSAQSSFQNLADSILARATGDRGLEDMTRELLRGMLKSWLDDNLPDMVERLVREEIERVARRGR